MSARTRIKISEATAKQLRDFGEIALGLEIGGRENSQIMLGKIAATGYSLDDIPDLSSPEPSQPGAAPVGEGNPSYRMGDDGVPEHRILIPESDKPGGSDPVQVGVNGRLILIARGTPSWVPEPYVEALRNAVEFVYEEFKGQKAENGIDIGGLSKPRSVQSYPFQTA